MSHIEVIRGDITKIRADAIVNAANSLLQGGGGVDGAIHRAGGPKIMAACRQIKGGCPTGQAVITTAGNLPAKHIIHTAGPVWKGGKQGEVAKLASCYRSSLELALAHAVKTITFPNISTGVYGYPKDKAAAVAVKTVKDFLSEHHLPETVLFVCFDTENFALYQGLLAAEKTA